MNRRNFMLALGALEAIPEPPRAYSFVWDNSITKVQPLDWRLIEFDYAYFEKKIFAALRVPVEYLRPRLSSGRAQEVRVQVAVDSFRRQYPAVGQLVDDVKKRST